MEDKTTTGVDARLDQMFAAQAEIVSDVSVETQKAILSNMRIIYVNSLQQSVYEMRIATALKDDGKKGQIREMARGYVVALDEIDAMIEELNPVKELASSNGHHNQL